MNDKNQKKLQINKTTLRNLAPSEAADIVGGNGSGCPRSNGCNNSHGCNNSNHCCGASCEFLSIL